MSKTKTIKALQTLAQSTPPSICRAKVYGIAAKIERLSRMTIAEALSHGHSSADGALREASYLVDAGAATQVARPGYHGTYNFLDGSTLS